MSFVNVAPQLVSTAAADAARIGSAINTANTAAAATTQVLAAAQDEVSTAIAALFGSHGQHYQAISAQVAAYQQRFVLALSQAGSTYAVAEAASATPLQQIEQALLGVINTPTEALVGRKLIGDGAHGAPAPVAPRAPAVPEVSAATVPMAAMAATVATAASAELTARSAPTVPAAPAGSAPCSAATTATSASTGPPAASAAPR